jgi:hypothetical protein
MENDGGMILTGENRRTRRKPCPSATLSTTNPTWIDPGANPGLRVERLATNRLSYGSARGYVYANGFVVLTEVLDMFRLWAVANGGNLNPSGNLSFTEGTFVWHECLGVEPIAFAEGLCDLGGIIFAECLHDWRRWAVTLFCAHSLKLTVLPHSEININVPGNMISPVKQIWAVYKRGITSVNCNDNFNISHYYQN